MTTPGVAAADLNAGPPPKLVYWAPGLPYHAVALALARTGAGAEAVREFWDRNGLGETGRLYFVGIDARGREVYAAGLGGAAVTASRAAQGVIAACCDEPAVVFRRWNAPRAERRAAALAALAHAVWRTGLKGPALALLARAAQPDETSEYPEPQALSRAPAKARRRFVFYHCYGSAHSSVVTAALHLGMLPIDRLPAVRDILWLRWFDRVRHREIGFPIHIGDDESGVSVYVVGLGPSRSCARRFVEEVIEVGGLGRVVTLVDCLPLATGLVRAGGFLSRRLGLVFPGRLIAAAGIRRSYWRFVSLACRTRLRVNGGAGAVDARLRATP